MRETRGLGGSMGDGEWSAYYRANDGREPRPMLLEVLAGYDEPGRAVDLGCGAGIDTVAMLERGWDVLAIDAEAEAIERLAARTPADATSRLRTQLAPMEDADLPEVDLVWASYSLFFCDPRRFPEVWNRIGAALRAEGRIACQLLGDRDTWAGGDRISSFDRDAALALFDGWTLERFEEDENDGDACSGPKHWHVFHVVARRDGARPQVAV
ncbi:MAG: class I SAM-dependent methyltransferase [Planctomycetaceae bacterium]